MSNLNLPQLFKYLHQQQQQPNDNKKRTECKRSVEFQNLTKPTD